MLLGLPAGRRDGHRAGRLASAGCCSWSLLTTPLQSAAEEYLFRGYLSQAIAGWIRRPAVGAVVAAVVTAALFSLAHAPGDLPTFLDRFAFGLAASAVVWLTGGLEAAIVLHAVNNVLVFVLAGALGDGVATERGPGRRAACCTSLISLLADGRLRALVGRGQRAGCGRRRAPPRRTCGRPAAAGPGAGRADPPLPGWVPPGPEPSGIVFCGAARCHPWGMG